jgi:hypothetical protein
MNDASHNTLSATAMRSVALALANVPCCIWAPGCQLQLTPGTAVPGIGLQTKYQARHATTAAVPYCMVHASMLSPHPCLKKTPLLECFRCTQRWVSP